MVSATYPMFGDFTAMFGRQARFTGVFRLAVLAERGDTHSGCHISGCEGVNACGVCVDASRREEAQGELGC